MPDIGEYEAFRTSIVEAMRRELVGPQPDDPAEIQTEFLTVSPLNHYAMGVLFPQRALQEHQEDAPLDEDVTVAEEEESSPTDTEAVGVRGETRADLLQAVEGDTEDEPLNLANEFSPSALGVSFRVEGCSAVRVAVHAGRYERAEKEFPNPRAGTRRADGTVEPETVLKPGFRRKPLMVEHVVSLGLAKGAVDVEGAGGSLKLHFTIRGEEDGRQTVSLMLVNHNEMDGDGPARFDRAWFQAGMDVRDDGGGSVFCPIDRESGVTLPDEQASMDLLYRHRRSYALGHGCAGDWHRDAQVEEAGRTTSVRSTSFPLYEVAQIRPREKPLRADGLNLSMSYLSAGEGASGEQQRGAILRSLEALCEDYSSWIDDRESEAEELEGQLVEAASRHLESCRRCLDRMREGLQALADDPLCLLAFRLANRAMLMQQLHTSRPLRSLDSSPVERPQYDDGAARERRWRPFQLAFILMNAAGTAEPEHRDREVVDLIWFPTGGGKTEAYLGLTAYAICLRRLRAPHDVGTAVLMRYTLRLLTAQQFQRAASLVLALETLRRERFLDACLGAEPIGIGLWVGKSLSPNKRADAVRALRGMRSDKANAVNPFQVLHCPWCRTVFDDRRKLGYVDRKAAGESTVGFRCPARGCDFADDYLPIAVIDEDIYHCPPTLLIGTVDKFAQIAWLEETGSLFGLDRNVAPPELVIQDELHLIAGPLGSIVGLYETAMMRMCCRGEAIPKVVASTATIRRASEQCHALYGRTSFEFPPAGLKAGDSYFAYEDDTVPGRLYAGVFPSALKSLVTAEVRTCASLLQAVRLEAESHPEGTADPYGTVVWYFNSLRELGHATTLCDGDIPEQLVAYCRRRGISPSLRRKIYERVELTSRRSADEIPRILAHLETPWVPTPSRPFPVDVLFATNMISVGVDVPRLGVMVVTGQPKTTAEYIQATSRVGRRFPGLVVTLYNHCRTRDRSHFERFVAYHQSIYRSVEPTSVTPFSPPARDRALRGVLVALARLTARVSTPELLEERMEEVRGEVAYIAERIRRIDPEEVDDAVAEMNNWLDQWQKLQPSEYGRMGGVPDTTTLMFPAGSERDEEFQEKAWPVLTSMRNVDGTCSGRVVALYDEEEAW